MPIEIEINKEDSTVGLTGLTKWYDHIFLNGCFEGFFLINLKLSKFAFSIALLHFQDPNESVSAEGHFENSFIVLPSIN